MKKLMIPIVLALVVIIGVFIVFNGDDNREIKVINNETELLVSFDEVKTSQNSTTFPVVVRSSGSVPVEAEYTGIELITFLEEKDVKIENFKSITFNASDGYRIILSSEDISEPLNVYLTYERDGEDLLPKSKGGNGPFQLVIRKDPFSQRWIKHVEEIIINY